MNTRIRTHVEASSKVNVFETVLNSKLLELSFEDYTTVVVDYKNVTVEFVNHEIGLLEVATKSYEDAMKISGYLPKDMAVEFPEEYTPHNDILGYFSENALEYYSYGSMPWK